MEQPSTIQNFQQNNSSLTYHNFYFKMDILNGKVNMSPALSNHFECNTDKLNYSAFMSMIPHEEYTSLYRIHQMLLMFFNTQKKMRYECTFVLVHNFLSKKGKKTRMLRQLHFIQSNDSAPLPICQNHCVDVTNIHFNRGVLFDVNLPEDLKHKKFNLMKNFMPILKQKEGLFSERELEVLKIWQNVDSIDLAAVELNISVRTLETHLRNMRKKLGVKRSMDLVLYAKERSWI